MFVVGWAETDSILINVLEKEVTLTCRYPSGGVVEGSTYRNPITKIATFKRLFRFSSCTWTVCTYISMFGLWVSFIIQINKYFDEMHTSYQVLLGLIVVKFTYYFCQLNFYSRLWTNCSCLVILICRKISLILFSNFLLTFYSVFNKFI